MAIPYCKSLKEQKEIGERQDLEKEVKKQMEEKEYEKVILLCSGQDRTFSEALRMRATANYHLKRWDLALHDFLGVFGEVYPKIRCAIELATSFWRYRF